MQTSTQTRAEARPVPRNGFTLVELMVVVAMMGLLAGAVVLTAGAPGGGPGDSATRFAGRLAAARDQAIVTSEPISAWVSASGYGFDRFRGGHWQAMTEKPFGNGNWEQGIEIDAAGAATRRPRVRFDSLGMADEPFELRISRDGQAATIHVAANGDVEVE